MNLFCTEQSGQKTNNYASFFNIKTTFPCLFYGLCVCCQRPKKKAKKHRKTQLKIDSLLGVLKTDLGDQKRTVTYKTLGELYQKQKKTEKALDAFFAALDHIEGHKTPEQLAMLYENIGSIYYAQHNYPLALEYYFTTFAVRQQMSDKGKVAILLFNIATIYRDYNDYPKALEYYGKALEMFLKNPKIYKYSINGYHNIAIVYRNMENYDKAIEYQQKALEVSQELKSKLWVAHSQNGLGNLYVKQGEIAKALVYYSKALKFYSKAKNKIDLASCWLNIANVYLRKGEVQANDNIARGLKVFKKFKYKVGLSQVYQKFSRSYQLKGDYDKALEYSFKSLKIAEELGHSGRILTDIYSIGRLYFGKGNISIARKYYHKGYKMAEKLGSRSHISNYLRKIGLTYKAEGNYIKAMQYYQKALKFTKQKERENTRMMSSLGAFYSTQSNYEQALQYFEKYIRIARKNSLTLDIARGLSQVAWVHYRQKKYDDAIRYYRQCLVPSKKHGYKYLLRSAYNGLAEINLAKGKLDTAENQANKSYTIMMVLKKTGSLTGLPASHNILGKVYLRQKKYVQALEHYQKAAGLCQRMKSLIISYKDAQEGLSICYEQLHQPQRALDHHKLYKKLTDSLFNQNNTRKITQLTAEYTFGKEKDSLKTAQAQEKLKLNANIRQQKTARWGLTAGLSLIALLLITLGVFYRSKQRNNRVLTDTNVQLVQLDEFKQQMLGMIVHDLKNPLSSIIGLSEEEGGHKLFAPINRSGRRMLRLVMNITGCSENGR